MALRIKAPGCGILILFCFLLVGQTDEPISENAAPAISMGKTPLPPELLRPRYGEDPLFSRDYVIGKMGRCDASEESYRYARLIVAGLAAGDGKTEGVQFSEQKRLYVKQGIGSLGTRAWRVGGGRVEPDGSVSFLIRFLGRANSVTGELYLRKEEPKAETEEAEKEAALLGEEIKTETGAAAEKEDSEEEDVKTRVKEETIFWLVDDVLLEPPRSLAEGKFGPGGADMKTYERFF